MRCPHCNGKVDPIDKFCRNCGRSVTPRASRRRSGGWWRRWSCGWWPYKKSPPVRMACVLGDDQLTQDNLSPLEQSQCS